MGCMPRGEGLFLLRVALGTEGHPCGLVGQVTVGDHPLL